MTPSIDELRCQCRIDGDDENGLLTLYAQVAKKCVENYVNRPLYDECVPEDIPDGLVISDDIKLAIMLAVGFWYENKEAKSLPPGFTALLEPYRFIRL